MPDVSGYKYLIKLKFNVEGIVEKPDVIGAIFGQTEGLFGPELDLNELQKNWRIGRIELSLKHANSKTAGRIFIPSNTDIAAATLIAAAIESIDKVGPYTARFKLDGIEDVRATRRKQIVERAKEILREWSTRTVSEGEDALKELYEALKPSKIISYGPENLPAGPGIYSSDTIILVEGRADVLNMLRAGYEDVIAIGGARVPESVVQLVKNKRKIAAFLDGDRGGELILKELQNKIKLTHVFRAPHGKEVEELTPEDIQKILEGLEKPREELPVEVAGRMQELVSELDGTLEVALLDSSLNVVTRLPVSKLYQAILESNDIRAIVYDGIITQRIIDAARSKGIGVIVGIRHANDAKVPEGIKTFTFDEIRGMTVGQTLSKTENQ